jgi:hypothetical protein
LKGTVSSSGNGPDGQSSRAALIASALRLSYFTIAWNGVIGATALLSQPPRTVTEPLIVLSDIVTRVRSGVAATATRGTFSTSPSQKRPPGSQSSSPSSVPSDSRSG